MMLIEALSEALADHAERHPECDCEWPLVISQHFALEDRTRSCRPPRRCAECSTLMDLAEVRRTDIAGNDFCARCWPDVLARRGIR